MTPIAAPAPTRERFWWTCTALLFLAILVYGFDRRARLLDIVSFGELPNRPPRLASDAWFFYEIRERRPYPRISPLTGDAAGFYHLSLRTPYPCCSTEREPFFLLIARTALILFGNLGAETWEETLQDGTTLPGGEDRPARQQKVFENHLVLRWTGVALSLAALVALFLVSLWQAGRLGALCAAFLWADNSFLTYYGVDFLREDLVTALHLTLLALFLGLVLGKIPGKRRAIGAVLVLAFVGVMLALTRLESLGSFLLMSIACGIAKFARRQWRAADFCVLLLANLVLWLAVLPYLLYCREKTGEFFHVLHNAAKFWRNHEFAGQPGYPTVSEVVRDSFTGTDVTTFQYVFGLHSLREVSKRVLGGYWRALTLYLPKLFSDWPILLVLALAGVLCCLMRGSRGLLIVLMALISLAPNVFIMSLDKALGVKADPGFVIAEPRFAVTFLAYVILFSSIGLDGLRRWIAPWFERRSPSADGKTRERIRGRRQRGGKKHR